MTSRRGLETMNEGLGMTMYLYTVLFYIKTLTHSSTRLPPPLARAQGRNFAAALAFSARLCAQSGTTAYPQFVAVPGLCLDRIAGRVEGVGEAAVDAEPAEADDV